MVVALQPCPPALAQPIYRFPRLGEARAFYRGRTCRVEDKNTRHEFVDCILRQQESASPSVVHYTFLRSFAPASIEQRAVFQATDRRSCRLPTGQSSRCLWSYQDGLRLDDLPLFVGRYPSRGPDRRPKRGIQISSLHNAVNRSNAGEARFRQNAGAEGSYLALGEGAVKPAQVR